MDAEDDGKDGEEGEDPAVGEELIDEDMPCIRCGYNLRGLTDAGRCPECGTLIEKTVAFVMQRVLCPTCLGPNHPSASLCVHCNSPVGAAAATADYWRPHAVSGGRRKQPEEEEEPEAPSVVWPFLCWMVGLFLLWKLSGFFTALWNAEPRQVDTTFTIWGNRIFGGLVLLLISCFPLALIYLPTRSYVRSRRTYVREHTAFLEKELAAEASEPATEKAEPEEV